MNNRSNATVRIEVFRPGTFTPMQGGSISYSAADLRAAADAYDKDAAPAPVVVGHPSTDAPAYAWAQSFEYDASAGRLYADVGEINPSFAEAVRKGTYKKVSLSFHRPDSSANPVPGTWYPKHIGFLGGAAPAVTGLQLVQFSEGPAGVEFVADFVGVKGFGKSDRATTRQTSADPAFAAREAQFAEREAEFAVREAEWKKRERELVGKDNADFAERMVSEGRLLPVHKSRIVSILNSAADSAAVSFAEGEEPVPMLQAFRDVLKELPKVVSFGALDLGPDPDRDVRPSIVVPNGYTVDPGQVELHNRARQIEREKGVSFAEAVDIASGR